MLYKHTYKVDPDVRIQYGYHALHFVAIRGQERVIKWLIDTHKVNVDVTDKNKQTPLHLAEARHEEKAYALLVDLGARKEGYVY